MKDGSNVRRNGCRDGANVRKNGCNFLRRVLMVVPLMILVGERVFGSIRIVHLFQPLSTTTSTTTTTTTTPQPEEEHEEQRTMQSIPPIDKNSENSIRTSIPSLVELTTTRVNVTCPNDGNFTWIANRLPNTTRSNPKRRRRRRPLNRNKIPRIIHQTSKSRCLTKGLAKSVEQWNPMLEKGWSYVFHDDAAVEELFSIDYPEFPHLKLVTKHCLHYGTVKADLWRYLVLYVYGGLYADLDTHPNYDKFQASSSITPDMQGFFVVEQYHILSQYFMAMAPRHPLMYYAIQHSLLNIYSLVDTREVYAPGLTGPHALHAAYQDYRKDAGVDVTPHGRGYKPVWRGTFEGTHNTTITVVGHGERETEWVIRESLRIREKRAEYALMGMRHFKDDLHQQRQDVNRTFAGRNCIHAMLPKPQQERDYTADLINLE